MKLQSYVKNFTCGTGSENSETVYYFVYDSVPINLRQHLPLCRGSFQVLISSTALEKLLKIESGNNELGEVLNEGFEVAYIFNSGACDACEKSGGSCGGNSTDGALICYCRDKSPNRFYCPHSKYACSLFSFLGVLFLVEFLKIFVSQYALFVKWFSFNYLQIVVRD